MASERIPATTTTASGSPRHFLAILFAVFFRFGGKGGATFLFLLVNNIRLPFLLSGKHACKSSHTSEPHTSSITIRFFIWYFWETTHQEHTSNLCIKEG